MPTGTSTIFGVFQAILALLVGTGRNSPSQHKLLPDKKFASEIFLTPAFCCGAKGIHGFVRHGIKQRGINRFKVQLRALKMSPVA
jgi:hypothetical protein